ncbi:endothelial protein C receptor [Anolis carolinensis]|uniref:MHC class I-like antigen recognition-like domain-containing protein n=1 Tax=Anolis carolinensis TaxID=28377 RepID=G1KID5_ANOCA|nr:PREDICTED: endothelial protein C receptor [Anolis carolinensis]|eukprot:XP_003218416.1 PREDICTED: endothelial protein C receptor [Anolis carolinensis]
MLFFNMFLLSLALCHWAYGAESHNFTMVQYSYFPNKTLVESVGYATLDGTRTHTLESHNGHVNVSQLLPLETSDRWEMRRTQLHDYLSRLKALVYLLTLERNISYPLEVHCTATCQLSENGTSSFFEVLLNKVEFLIFRGAKNGWEPLQETSEAIYASTNLNKYNETRGHVEFFLQETCINFIREHTDVKEALTGKREGRPHTPLVLGIILGALAIMGFAVCLFLCTGGRR